MILYYDKTITNRLLDLARSLMLETLVIESVEESKYTLPGLFFLNQKLELRSPTTGLKNEKPISLDFNSEANRFRYKQPIGKSDLLAKAIGYKYNYKTILDATVGMGGDLFYFMNLGLEVTGCEQNPLLYLLIQYALDNFDQQQWTNDRCILPKEVTHIDSVTYMQKSHIKWDVVYLDPMFPGKIESAKSKKNMFTLQKYFAQDKENLLEQEKTLLSQALISANKRVVVKRHLHSPKINEKVALSFKGNSVRYDVYLK